MAAVVEERGGEPIALGRTQALEQGRAHIVHGTLERTRSPVLLVPAGAPAQTARRTLPATASL